MELKDLNRLLSGVTYIARNSDIYQIRPASLDLRQRADLYYEQLINSNRFEPAFSREVFERICILQGVLDKDYKKNIEETNETLENLKVQLFESEKHPNRFKQIKRQIDVIKQSLNKQRIFAAKILANTLEGTAENARDKFIFLHRIYDSNDCLVFENCDSCYLLNHITYNYSKQMLSDTEIREIARSGNWRNIWSHKKESSFLNPIETLTDEQSALLHFSTVYDFAYQHEKCPAESVFEDDDCFDGWYIKQLRDIKDKRKQRRADDDGDSKYGEIYKLASNKEEAKQIYDLNADESKKAIRERQKLIQEKGKVRDLDFSDVKKELQMRAQNSLKQKFKTK